MDPVTKGFLIFGAALGYIAGICVPPIVHASQNIRLGPAEYGLQSFFPFIAGLILFFGCLFPVYMESPDDSVRGPLIFGGIAIIAISTSCLVALFGYDRALRMAN